MQEFHYASPEALLKLVKAYAGNIYGANVWDLFSKDCTRLFTSYNVAVRSILKIPRTSHRYLLETLSDTPHLYTDLLSRYVTFAKGLLSNDALEVRFLACLAVNDMRTVLGRNIWKIGELCQVSNGIEGLSPTVVKKKVFYATIPQEETWRIGIIRDMKNMSRNTALNIGLSEDEISTLLVHACTS